MTPLAEAATQLNEMYRALVESGFTEKQALHIIGVMITTGTQGDAK